MFQPPDANDELSLSMAGPTLASTSYYVCLLPHTQRITRCPPIHIGQRCCFGQWWRSLKSSMPTLTNVSYIATSMNTWTAVHMAAWVDTRGIHYRMDANDEWTLSGPKKKMAKKSSAMRNWAKNYLPPSDAYYLEGHRGLQCTGHAWKASELELARESASLERTVQWIEV
jgi:hypothetical protein